jgi:serine protease DegQ
MNTRTLLRGVDLAIPAVTLRRVVDELRQHGGVRRGYLGVGLYPVRLPASLASLAGGRARGAVVASLDDGGPAATGGVLVGDILVELDGLEVTGPDSLRTALADRFGRRATLAILRGGTRLELSLEIGSRP